MKGRWKITQECSSLAATCLGRLARFGIALFFAAFSLVPSGSLSLLGFVELHEETTHSAPTSIVTFTHHKVGNRLRRDPSRIDDAARPSTRWDILPAATLPPMAHLRGHSLANGLRAPLIC